MISQKDLILDLNLFFPVTFEFEIYKSTGNDFLYCKDIVDFTFLNHRVLTRG